MIPGNGVQGKGHIQRWSLEETKNGHLAIGFVVAGDLLAPQYTESWEDSETWTTRVTMTMSETADNSWILRNLQYVTGDKDFDIERLDPEHDNPYDLEGREVVVTFAEKEHNGRTFINASFLVPKPKPKLSKFGERFAELRRQQKEESGEITESQKPKPKPKAKSKPKAEVKAEEEKTPS